MVGMLFSVFSRGVFFEKFFGLGFLFGVSFFGSEKKMFKVLRSLVWFRKLVKYFICLGIS